MFKFLKRKEPQPDVPNQEGSSSNKNSFFNRIKNSLQKTRQQLTENLANLVLGKKRLIPH